MPLSYLTGVERVLAGGGYHVAVGGLLGRFIGFVNILDDGTVVGEHRGVERDIVERASLHRAKQRGGEGRDMPVGGDDEVELGAHGASGSCHGVCRHLTGQGGPPCHVDRQRGGGINRCQACVRVVQVAGEGSRQAARAGCHPYRQQRLVGGQPADCGKVDLQAQQRDHRTETHAVGTVGLPFGRRGRLEVVSGHRSDIGVGLHGGDIHRNGRSVGRTLRIGVIGCRRGAGESAGVGEGCLVGGSLIGGCEAYIGLRCAEYAYPVPRTPLHHKAAVVGDTAHLRPGGDTGESGVDRPDCRQGLCGGHVALRRTTRECGRGKQARQQNRYLDFHKIVSDCLLFDYRTAGTVG